MIWFEQILLALWQRKQFIHISLMWWSDTAGEKAEDGSSVGHDTEAESSDSDVKDEHETTGKTREDGLEHSSDDVHDSIPEKQLGEQGSSDSEKPGASDDTEEDDATVDKDIPATQETIRDRLENAGVRTVGNESLMLVAEACIKCLCYWYLVVDAVACHWLDVVSWLQSALMFTVMCVFCVYLSLVTISALCSAVVCNIKNAKIETVLYSEFFSIRCLKYEN